VKEKSKEGNAGKRKEKDRRATMKSNKTKESWKKEKMMMGLMGGVTATCA
jgi:hypothetical protein